jgi:hypothetical protein
MLRTLALAALLAAVPAPARAVPPDYTDYQALLDKYLVRATPRSKTTDTRFDFEQLNIDERIYDLRRSARLAQLHAELLVVRPSELSPADRLAWAINTYNFLVIERATMRLLIPGKHLTRFRSVDEMRTGEGGFFSSPIGEVDGRPCTLAEFERRYVCGDTSDVHLTRRMRVDPRWSLALCSGHLGDPPLYPRAFRGDSLEAQLDAATHSALAQPRFARFEPSTRRLDLGGWFSPRLADYGGAPASIVPFLSRFGPEELRKEIKKHPPLTIGLTLPLDAKLSQAPHANAMPDGSAAGTR